MTRKSLSLLHLKLFCVLVLALFVPLAIIGSITSANMKNTLSQGFLEKANILESRISEDLELAATVGIPMDRPAVQRDLEDYFTHLLMSHDEVEFVILKGVGTDFRIHAGSTMPEEIAHVDFSSLNEDMVKNVDDFLIMSRTLSHDGVNFARLYLGVDLSYPRDVLIDAGRGVVFALLAVVVMLWHVAAMVAERLYFEPKWLLARQKEDMVAQKPNFIVDGPAGGEFGYAVRLQNSLFKKMRESYREIVQDFVDVREAVFDPDVATSLEQERIKFVEKFGFLEEMGETSAKGRRPSAQRFVLMCLGGLVGSLIVLLFMGAIEQQVIASVFSCVGLLVYLRSFEAKKQRMIATKGTVWSLCVFASGLVIALLLNQFAVVEVVYGFGGLTLLGLVVHMLLSRFGGKI